MRVVELAADTLRRLGTRTLWGMPGGDSLPLVDAAEAAGLRFVLVRDEASAGFAADASAQLTGAPGACLATLGPGLTNLVSGVAGATLDRAPVLAFTSRSRSDRHARYTHMVLDQAPLFEASGKAWLRMTAGGAAGELRRAVATALAPRPGAVWLEVPAEVAGAPCEGEVPLPVAPLPSRPGPELAARVARWRRPVVLVGFAGRHADVEALAERLRAPVITSYKAKGALPEERGWAAGAAGLSPRVDALHRGLLDRADGVLLVGWDPVELRDHWLPGWGEVEVVALDTCPPVDLPARLDLLHVGDPAAAVDVLEGGDSAWTLDEVAAHRARVGALFEERVFGPATAIRAVQAGVGDEAVVSLDVGAHRITASHVWRAGRPDRLLQSNGFSSMGYGVPAALAAAAHGHRAVCVVGDMGLQMTLGELATAAEQGWPLTVVVLDDAALSLIALKQERLALPDRGVRFGNPDWARLAGAFGFEGAVVDDPAALRAAVARSGGAPTLIAARIDPAPYREQM